MRLVCWTGNEPFCGLPVGSAGRIRCLKCEKHMVVCTCCHGRAGATGASMRRARELQDATQCFIATICAPPFAESNSCMSVDTHAHVCVPINFEARATVRAKRGLDAFLHIPTQTFPVPSKRTHRTTWLTFSYRAKLSVLASSASRRAAASFSLSAPASQEGPTART
jgi:hypothetical protein